MCHFSRQIGSSHTYQTAQIKPLPVLFCFTKKFFQFFLKNLFLCKGVVKVCMILCNHSKGKPRKHGAEQKNKKTF